jgi:tetratricopeptide (TPR) repeat protein
MSKSDREQIQNLLVEARQAAEAKALDRAAEKLKAVLRLDPNNLRAIDLMGYVRFFQKRYNDSEAFCRKALAIQPDHAFAHAGLGMSLAKQGQLEAGVAALHRAMEIQPNWPEPYWDLAVALKDAGKPKEALDTLEQGTVNCPSSRGRFERLASHIRDLEGS